MAVATETYVAFCHGDVAWMNQATCCRAHLGPKRASHGFAVGTPKGSDFGPEKVGDFK
jgi:hypothetical protein